MPDTIYKYPLEVTDVQTIRLPRHSEILTVQLQHGEPCLWAIVRPELPLEDRIIEIYGTGHPMREVTGPRLKRVHINTFQMHGGALVFHAFEIAVMPA